MTETPRAVELFVCIGKCREYLWPNSRKISSGFRPVYTRKRCRCLDQTYKTHNKIERNTTNRIQIIFLPFPSARVRFNSSFLHVFLVTFEIRKPVQSKFSRENHETDWILTIHVLQAMGHAQQVRLFKIIFGKRLGGAEASSAPPPRKYVFDSDIGIYRPLLATIPLSH